MLQRRTFCRAAAEEPGRARDGQRRSEAIIISPQREKIKVRCSTMMRRREEEAVQPSREQLLKELADMKKQRSEDNARLEELRQSYRDLEALTRVTDNVIRTLDIREIVDTLLRRLVEVMDADAGTIVVQRDEKMWITASIGVGREEMPGFSAPAGENFAGIVFSTDKPLYVEDAQEDPRITSPFVREHGIRTMLGVPLRYREKAIGALYLLWFEVREENRRDIRLLEVTADRCAMAINNALLFDQVRQARDRLEQKVRDRTAELSDAVRDMNFEAEIRKRTAMQLRKARHEIDFYFDLMGHDIDERDRAALRAIEEAIGRMDARGGAGKDDVPLLLEALRNIEGSVQITRNVRTLREAVAERQTPQIVDLREILTETVARFSGARGGEVKIELRMSKMCERVGCKVTATGLHGEVYDNIIRNAIERSSGPLAIRVLLEVVKQNEVQVCRVTIEDDGPGISDDLKRQVFEIGELDIAEKRIEGLGLYVVRTLVESAGGKVSVEDRVPGDYKRGSRFIVTVNRFIATLPA